MSARLLLPDGTESVIRYCYSDRPVVVGFKESELEKLLALKPDDKVNLDGGEVTYKIALRRVGKIVAYVPDAQDYLKICNKL